MGTRNDFRRPLAWQGTLAQMRANGTRVAQACIRGDCRRWANLNVDELIRQFGEDFMLWDRRPPCPACGDPTHYMAAPGPSTPFRPLLGGLVAQETKRQFLKSFGFTRRDVRRIQALAEATVAGGQPAALADLDVPYRVGACMPGQESYVSGQILGEWAGRTLLWWPMNEREEQVWRRNRSSGPKPMPKARTRDA